MDRGDFEGMRNHLSKIDWDTLLDNTETVDVWWDIIEDIVNKAKDIFIPKKKVLTKILNKHVTHKRTFAAPDTLLNKLKLKRYACNTYKKIATV